MIYFSQNLFLTDAVRPKIDVIRFKNYSGIGMVSACFITLAANENDVFDIYPSSYFKQKNLRKRDFYVCGVAESKKAAMKMISDMIAQSLLEGNEYGSLRKYFENKINW